MHSGAIVYWWAETSSLQDYQLWGIVSECILEYRLTCSISEQVFFFSAYYILVVYICYKILLCPFFVLYSMGGKRSVEKHAFACFLELATATPIEIYSRRVLYIYQNITILWLQIGYKLQNGYNLVSNTRYIPISHCTYFSINNYTTYTTCRIHTCTTTFTPVPYLHTICTIPFSMYSDCSFPCICLLHPLDVWDRIAVQRDPRSYSCFKNNQE